MKNLSELQGALNSGDFVRITRRFEPGRIRGYIMDIGPEFFLMALISDRVWPDGFECFRVADLKGLEKDPYARFVEAALRKRKIRRPRKPRVDLQTTRELLISANRAFPLISIHRERVAPDICHIGRVVGSTESRIEFQEIDPNAKWISEPTRYSINQITRVNFGGDYERALELVGC